ncbi:uncharacterized protein BCR38DRAFT_118205 [Pseudomassariella vexata]|uniref:Uncharacterized protein n=1 Tax=Pseudomassariella vexata TaxID=1141098 RepID=A0A1Y2DAT1_9PEZI|nr:uncharacterized protein BCR38DRAFT_118205 [Pseudomassariella vexata]ORY56383.1 hypothetical protein BCR38DRAFT_118205 [Pseudomassariella vexata]
MFEQGESYSPFKPTKSLLDPSAFRINHPGVPLVHSPPKRLPVSKSSRQAMASPKKTKAPSDSPKTAVGFKTPKQSSIDDESPTHVRSPGKDHNDPASISNLTQRQKPSVANLRKSFEQNLTHESTAVVPETPTRNKEGSSISVRHSNRQSKDQSHSSESMPRSPEQPLETPVQQTKLEAATPPSAMGRSRRMELKQSLSTKSSGQFSPTPPSVIPIRRIPATALPTSTRSRQRQAMQMRSRTFERPNSLFERTPSSVPGPVEKAEPELRPEPEPEAGTSQEVVSKGFPRSSPIHPLFLSNTGRQERLQREEHQEIEPLASGPESSAEPGQISPTRRSNDIQPSVMDSIPVEVLPIADPVTKSDSTTKRSMKVSDLRRMFDRPSFSGSSPGHLMSLARATRCTRPNLGTDHSNPGKKDASPTTSVSSGRSSQKTTSAPELTTEIAINDFAVEFTSKSELVIEQDQSSPTKPRARFDIPVGLKAAPKPIPKQMSPLKDRIQLFESKDHASLTHGRAKSYDTSLHTKYQAKGRKGGRSKTTTSSWRPIRDRGARMLRRISNSLTQSVDGGNDSVDSGEVSRRHTRRGKSSEKENANPVPDEQPCQTQRRRSSLFSYLHQRSNHSTLDSGTQVWQSTGQSTEEVAHGYPKRHDSTRSRGGSSIDINDSLVATLETSRPYLRYARSPIRPSPLFPALPARKSFPFLQRFSGGENNRGSIEFGFGLDGQDSSKMRREKSSNILSNPDAAAGTEDLPTTAAAAAVAGPSSAGQQNAANAHTPYPAGTGSGSVIATPSPISTATAREKRKFSREKRKEARALRKAGRRASREAQKQSAHAQSHSPHNRNSQKNNQASKLTQQQQQRERRWGDYTASGFPVHPSKLGSGTIAAPKPTKPHEVRRIIEKYRWMEKSTSVLTMGFYGRKGSKDSQGQGQNGEEGSANSSRKASDATGKGKTAEGKEKAHSDTHLLKLRRGHRR